MPSVAEVSKVYGIEVAQSVVTLAVSDLIKSINVGKTMDVSQKAQAVSMLIECHPYMTLADVKFFSFRFKRGDFGKQYDRLDTQVIMQAAEQYFSEKSEVVGEMSANTHYRAKKTEYNQPYHPSVVDAIKRAVGEKKVGEVKPVEEKKLDIGQVWIRQFNNLHRKYGIETGIRMIQIGSEKFDITGFLNRKASNYEKMDR
ncbi:hypothetical protein [Parapedobacter lycopersici]|uniref:hypothetical protein n=1 Tax=Parapedobacter lycopersici TaxID=1864939 RepID=UPI00214DCC66|nr:hypothetical protein [Parapedobacter lycopersici]